MKSTNLYKRIKNFFYPKRESLTQEQINYVLSGFSDSILRDYQIIYSPKYIQMSRGNQGRGLSSFPKNPNSLEKRIVNSIENIWFNHRIKMEKLRLDHLRRLNEIYSSVINTYREKSNNLKQLKILDNSKGVTFYFN